MSHPAMYYSVTSVTYLSGRLYHGPLND